MANNEIVEKVTKAQTGFVGPIGLSIDLIVDSEVMEMENFYCWC